MYDHRYDSYARPVTAREGRARTMGHVVYALYFVALFTGLSIVVGAIVAYILRGDAQGTIYRSHFDYLISTFWIALVVGIIGGILTLLLIGWAILGLLWLWLLYRTAKGWIRLNSGQPA